MSNLIEEEDFSNNRLCINCGELITLSSNFCGHCGKNQTIEKTSSSSTKFALVKLAAFFYGLHLLLCLLAKLDQDFQSFSWSISIDFILAIISFIFFSLNWRENKELLKWKNFSFSKLCAFMALAIFCNYIVNYTVDWLNIVIYNKDEHFNELLRHSYIGIFILIFFNAVMPAIFEEIGFRGYLLSNLINITEVDQAIYISAFLFAIIHLSFISLFWLIPFALFLGFTRIKEQTIWYGVIFHFTFNCTSEILSLIKH